MCLRFGLSPGRSGARHVQRQSGRQTLGPERPRPKLLHLSLPSHRLLRAPLPLHPLSRTSCIFAPLLARRRAALEQQPELASGRLNLRRARSPLDGVIGRTRSMVFHHLPLDEAAVPSTVSPPPKTSQGRPRLSHRHSTEPYLHSLLSRGQPRTPSKWQATSSPITIRSQHPEPRRTKGRHLSRSQQLTLATASRRGARGSQSK